MIFLRGGEIRRRWGLGDDSIPLDGVGCKVSVVGIEHCRCDGFWRLRSCAALRCMGHHCGAMQCHPPRSTDTVSPPTPLPRRKTTTPEKEPATHVPGSWIRLRCGVRYELLAFTSHSDPSCCHFLIPASRTREGSPPLSSLCVNPSIHCSSLSRFIS